MPNPPPIDAASTPLRILDGLHTSLAASPEGRKLLTLAAAKPGSGIRAPGPLSGSPDRTTGLLKILAPYLTVLSGEADPDTEFARWVVAKRAWFIAIKEDDLRWLALWPRIEAVGIQQSRLTGVAIEHLAAGLPNLRELSLDTFTESIGAALPLLTALETFNPGEQKNLGDAHVPNLLALRRLKSIRLGKCAISLAGYAKLATHPALASVELYAADDDTVVALGGARSMRKLRVVLAKVTDGGLTRLAAAGPKLESLELTRAGKVTDAGVAALAPLQCLRVLNLSGSNLTDKSAPVMAGFQNLVELDVGSTKLTDKSVPTLTQLKGLTMLRVTGTKITPAGLGQLGKALRGCNLVTLG